MSAATTFRSARAPTCSRRPALVACSVSSYWGRILLRGHPLHAANACVKLLNHMVQYMTTRLDTSFAALSDATRRGVLEQAGVVTTKKIGRVRTCKLGPRRLEEETPWLERYRQRWDERFDELDKVVEELTRKEKSDERKNRK